MDIKLLPLRKEEMSAFKADMQDAFQRSAEKEFGKIGKDVLPEADIDRSLSSDGAAAYCAVLDGKTVGGAVVCIDANTQVNHLDLLYVKHGWQGKGVGQAIWNALERLYPQTAAWETVTPYFEKRNIHFYINVCGFHAVEFFNPFHRDPAIPQDMVGGDYFFRFRKTMRENGARQSNPS